VQNSAHKIFLRQDPNKFHLTAEAFNLTPQQADVIMRLKTVKGAESQFYLLSDIGEGALVLPVEPAFYWVSTNNGDDNQLFSDILVRHGNDFSRALEEVVNVAPYGSKDLHDRLMGGAGNQDAEDGGVGGAISQMMDTGFRDSGA
jgi:hypothetical protein